MHKETVACEKALKSGEITLIPVVRVSITCLQIKGKFTFHAVKQPEYIVVCRDGTVSIFNMAGEQVPKSRARVECPGLDAALADCSGLQA